MPILFLTGGQTLAMMLGAASPAPVAQPMQSTVECQSRSYKYEECWAGSLRSPQLVHQISSSACIVNRSWGYNRNSGYIWVANGCSGVFADVGGYHHGRGDTYDPGARAYGERGHDTGAVVAGAVLGALIAGAVSHDNRKHMTSNVNHDADHRYTGCHGVGCRVDNPDRGRETIDTRPSFDRDGNPNFDTKGNWQGCHGAGCLVDNPEGD
ncbi:DUF3011 domain-containing protein [Sphingomonas aestuarii]|jgi:hypothetical protein